MSVGRFAVIALAIVLGVAAAVVSLLIWASSGDHSKAARAACNDALRLVDARLFDEARAAYRDIAKARLYCAGAGMKVVRIEARAAKDREQGDQYLHAAQLSRKAEIGAEGRKAEREARRFAHAKLVDVDRAIAGYTRSFRDDPQDPATRRGLTKAVQLLDVPGDRAADARCAAADRLWAVQALDEAAILYAQALRTGRTSRCVFYNLRAARRDRAAARSDWRMGQAQADAGHKQAARAWYISALQLDPSLAGARTSLGTTRPPDPGATHFRGRFHAVEHAVQAAAVKGDAGSTWLSGHAGAFAVAAVVAAVLVVVLMWLLYGLTRVPSARGAAHLPAFCRRRALISPFTPADVGDSSTTVFAHWIAVKDPRIDDAGDEAIRDSDHAVDAWDGPTTPSDDLAGLFSGQSGVLAAAWALLRRSAPRDEARIIGRTLARGEHGPGLRVLVGKRNGTIKTARFWWATDLPGPPLTNADDEAEARHALAIWAAAWARQAAKLP